MDVSIANIRSSDLASKHNNYGLEVRGHPKDLKA